MSTLTPPGSPATLLLSLTLTLAMAGLLATPAMSAETPPPSAAEPATASASTATTPAANRQAVQAAFERWRAGTGSPFELLADEATWTITGRSVVSRTYVSREDFMAAVIRPFNSRLAKPLRPTVPELCCEGVTVVARFQAEATATDGTPYRNTYAWFMEMKGDRIVKVTAFFDSIAFDDFWQRVPAAPAAAPAPATGTGSTSKKESR